MDNKISYILGVYMGDGSASVYKRKDGKGYNYSFRLTVIDEDFVLKTAKYLPKKNYSIYKLNRDGRIFYQLYSRDRELVLWLRKVTNNKTIIPKGIKIKPFLEGLMDSEGWVQKSSTGQIQIGFCSTNYWINDVKRLFEEVGVKTCKLRKEEPSNRQGKIKSKKVLYRFNINTQSFIDSKITFSIKRKQERLRDYNDISRRKLLKQDLRKKAVETVKNKEGLSCRELASITNVSRETIRVIKNEIKG